MGLPALQRLMSLQRNRRQRQRQIRPQIRSVSSVAKRKGSPCQLDGDGASQAAKIVRCSTSDLPEEIWRHIHSLMSMRDAARVACLSQAFLDSWRCHPILTLSRDVLGLNPNAHQENLSCKIDHILRNHSGTGIKIFRLELDGIFYACRYLDSWLRIAVTPGIEELTLMLCRRDKKTYSVPCSVLSDGVRNSIRCLKLSLCAFRPTAELGPLRNLSSLSLSSVLISGDELECFLSNCPSLKQLDLCDCNKISCLTIPGELQQLRCLEVNDCRRLRVIESNARNLSSFILCADRVKKLSLGEMLQMNNLSLQRANLVCYARTELPSTMPNLEALAISSHYEKVAQQHMKHESVFGGLSQLRQMPERHHGYLKSVKITGFSSAKSLIELTCYILLNARSLDCLTLDTTYGASMLDSENSSSCIPMGNGFLVECYQLSKAMLMEAPRAVMAIKTYIQDKVPSTVKLTVVAPCSRCCARGFEV